MTDEMVNTMFPTLIGVLADEGLQKILTTEQKRTILEAVEVHVEEIDDTHFRIGMLFVVLSVDSSDPDNPQMSITMDLSKLAKMAGN